MICETCELEEMECLKHFEVSAYNEEGDHIDDSTWLYINTGIDWAKKINADFIRVYQGCNRENEILWLNLGEEP